MADVRIIELTTRPTVNVSDYIAVDSMADGSGRISVGDLISEIIDEIPTWQGGSY